MRSITTRRASDPRRGDSYLGLELLHSSESHSAGDLFTDDVVGLDELGRHAEEGSLEIGLIGDDPPLEVSLCPRVTT